MEREEIFEKVQEVLEDALGVDTEEVTPEAKLTRDLGAESIDFLDITFKLEQAFGFKIQQGELFPDGSNQDPELIKDGKLTAKAIEQLQQRLGDADISEFEKDPKVSAVADLFTVDTLVGFVARKLAAAPAA